MDINKGPLEEEIMWRKNEVNKMEARSHGENDKDCRVSSSECNLF